MPKARYAIACIIPSPLTLVLRPINLEDDTLTLMEDKEINLDPTIQVLSGDRGTIKGITTPGIGEESHTPLL